MKRRNKFIVGAVSLALVAAACGSSGGGGSNNNASSNSGSGSSLPNQHFNLNNSGTAVKGGVLTMLGTGDVDYMDPNVSYYSIGYLGLRMWARSLYTYPATQGKTTALVPDLATAMPDITNGGKTYSITIRKGAMWDTTPARQVTAADAVLGLKRTCNPTQPFGGQPDFSTLIVGYSTFCTGFAKVSGTSAPAQKAYMAANQISGVTADPSNPMTLQINLTKPTSYFTDVLGLSAFDPAPVEFENYLPASNALAQHTISDGPYKVASYTPARSIDFVRNPAWQAGSDPVRKAYVNEVKVNETGNQAAIQQQIATNSPAADMEWDSFVPSSDIPGLLSANDKRLSLQSEYSSNPYVVFNTKSPNNKGAMSNVVVRQALEYALSRTDLIQDFGGPQVNPAVTQVLPPGISGSSPAYDLYPNNPTKAKAMLAKAGASGLTLKFLYRPATISSAKAFETIQADLGKIGIKVTGVGVPNADFYTKYLEVPSTAQSGVWDLSLAGWSPDWYGDAAASFFSPLFDGRVLPPTSSNFGLFNSPTVNADIDKALAATTTAQAAPLWHQADIDTMKAAAIFPITDPNGANFAGSQVHNTVYMAAYEQFDPTNVWLSK